MQFEFHTKPRSLFRGVFLAENWPLARNSQACQAWITGSSCNNACNCNCQWVQLAAKKD